MIVLSNERRQPINKMLNSALSYARNGYPVFPCDRQSKSPLTRQGFKDATTDEQQIRAWWTQHPNAMIGIPTGPASNIDVLDLDLKRDEYIDGREVIPNWHELSPLHVTTPGGGVHLWFKSEGQLRNSTDIIGPGVDTRGVGGYMIVPPSRTPDGKYAFVGNVATIEELPSFPPDLLALLGPQSEARANAKRRAAPTRVRKAMRVIPNNDVGWDGWKKWGLAIYAATNGSDEGLSIWQEWSAKSHKHDAANTRAEWQNIQRSPPTRIGAGSIFYAARQANPRWQAAEEIAADDTMESEADNADGAGSAATDSEDMKQADLLVHLATSAELFHSNDGNGYAEIKIGGERTHRETYAINSRDFKRWLTREYYRRTTSAPSSNAMATALLTIEAKAQFDGPEREVFLRAAGHDGKFYLDLCDADWRVLEIDAQGWRLVANPPVRFIRRKGMKALPLPKRFWTLKKYINVPNRADSRLR